MLFLNISKTMYTIKEKQKLLEQLKDPNHFESDLKLFVEKFPRHSLNRELARANNVNKDRLCSQMVYALLDVCTDAEIKAYRKQAKAAAKEAKKQTGSKPKSASTSVTKTAAKTKAAAKTTSKEVTQAAPAVKNDAEDLKKKDEPKA